MEKKGFLSLPPLVGLTAIVINRLDKKNKGKEVGLAFIFAQDVGSADHISIYAIV